MQGFYIKSSENNVMRRVIGIVEHVVMCFFKRFGSLLSEKNFTKILDIFYKSLDA